MFYTTMKDGEARVRGSKLLLSTPATRLSVCRNEEEVVESCKLWCSDFSLDDLRSCFEIYEDPDRMVRDFGFSESDAAMCHLEYKKFILRTAGATP